MTHEAMRLLAGPSVPERMPDFQGLGNVTRGALYLLAGPSVPDEMRREAVDRAETGNRVAKAEAQTTLTPNFSGGRRRCGVTNFFRAASRRVLTGAAAGPRGRGAESRACPAAARRTAQASPCDTLTAGPWVSSRRKIEGDPVAFGRAGNASDDNCQRRGRTLLAQLARWHPSGALPERKAAAASASKRPLALHEAEAAGHRRRVRVADGYASCDESRRHLDKPTSEAREAGELRVMPLLAETNERPIFVA